MDINELKKLIKKHVTRERIMFGGAIALSLLVILGVSLALLYEPLPGNNEDEDESVVFPEYRHPLTGELIESELPLLPQVFGVMIENSAEAWPLVGLDDAFLVIEAPVEGTIPRFIAFYTDEQEVDKIGPVRSARPYYLDWNDEFDAVYSHVGGSPEALDLISHYGTLDLNEFSQGEYYYRQNGSRYAPHNVYTNSTELSSAVEEIIELYELENAPPEYDAWAFKQDEPTAGIGVSFDLDWSDRGAYDVSWDYVVESNAYRRDQIAADVFLEDDAEVLANNVVVVETTVTIVDSQGRRSVKTVGTGEALVFQDGEVINATWRKDSRTSRLRFYDETNAEMRMNAGSTWIEVVDDMNKVTTR